MRINFLLKSLSIVVVAILLAVPMRAQSFSTAVADGVALYSTGDKPTAETAVSATTVSYRIVEVNGQLWAKTIIDKTVTPDVWSVQLRDWKADGNSKTELNLTSRAKENLVAFNENGYNVVTPGTTQMQFFLNCHDGGFHTTELFTFTQGEVATVEGDVTAPTLGTISYTVNEYEVVLTIPENGGEDCFYLLTDEGTGFTQVFMEPGTFTIILGSGALYNIAVQAVDYSGNRSEAQYIKHTTPFDVNANLALNRPVTASSGTATSGNDGNEGTRWESIQNDTEWWMVELASIYNLNYIEIKWEGAYSKHYTIDTSIDGDVWTSLEVTYDGGNGLMQTIDMSGVPAKYVRFQGIERATGYGNSFWEFRVYGLSIYDPSAADKLSVLQVSPTNAEIFVDETVEFSLVALSGDGAPIDGATYTVVAPANTTVTEKSAGVYEFYTSTPGNYVVDAKAELGGVEVEGTFKVYVKALPVLSTLEISAPYTVTAAGDAVSITLTAFDQYGVAYACTPDWVVDGDAAGEVLDMKYIAQTMGTANVYCKVGDVSSNVLAFNIVADGKNLALDKTVEAADMALNPANAVDGDWGSMAELYPQAGELAESKEYETYIIVDLAPVSPCIGYNINLIQTEWEGATAADYTVEVSLDKENWELYGTMTDGAGMLSRYDAFYPSSPIVNPEGVTTYGHRYVRLSVTKAATVYGVKLRELKVYGSSNYPTSVSAVEAAAARVWRAGDVVRATADVCALEVYNVAGACVATTHTNNMNIATLPAGVYVVRATTADGEVVSVKIVK